MPSAGLPIRPSRPFCTRNPHVSARRYLPAWPDMLKRPRRKMPISMTSLVDIIFLLLLFFMLTSTFSKFAEVTLSAASAGNAPSESPPIFLQLYPDRLTVNGADRPLDDLALEPEDGQAVLVSLQADVTAQRLTDALVALRQYPQLTVSVLGSN